MGILNFFGAAGSYVRPAAGCRQAAPHWHALYHYVIVGAGMVVGIGAALIGVPGMWMEKPDRASVRELVLGPAIFLMAGAIIGVSLASGLAPRSFLTGPMGAKWMQLIGTRNVIFARIVCLIIAGGGIAGLVFLANHVAQLASK